MFTTPLLQMLLYSGSKLPSVPALLLPLFLLIFFYVSLERLGLHLCLFFKGLPCLDHAEISNPEYLSFKVEN